MNENNNKWHLDKRISVGHLVSTLILTGLLIGGWMDVQGRLILLEEHPA